MADESLPLVFDTGSYSTKVGFAGADSPKFVFPTIIGYKPETGADDIAVGEAALDQEKNYTCLNPIQHGIVRNWGLAEKLWRHVFEQELKVVPEEHPLLMSEPPLNPKLHRERCCQLFFEVFNVPALYMAPSALLSLYGSAKTTGLVLNIGEGVTHTVPIHEGTILPYGICRLDIGGFDLTSHLIRFIDQLKTNTASDRVQATKVKETLCYVAQNYQDECKQMLENEREHSKTFELPDGNTVSLCVERVATPEMLFSPDIVGRTCPNLVDITYHSIRNVEPDLHRVMFNNILISGGSTMFSGFLERYEKDLCEYVNGNAQVRVSSSGIRRDLSVWLGGSVVGALPTFQQMWVTREEYDEAGPTVIHRKCF